MSRYKYTKLMKLGPVDGFMIHTFDNRKLKDTHPQSIVKELNRLNDEIEGKRKDVVWLATEKAKLEDRIKRLEEMYEGELGERPDLLGSNVMGLLKRELNTAQSRIKRLEEVLTWYESKVSDCNRRGLEGDAARDALAKDLGRKAKEDKL